MRSFLGLCGVLVLSLAALVPGQVQAMSRDNGAVAMAADEDRLVDAINAVREAFGAPDLDVDPSLSEVARLRSEDQAARHYFSHTTPDGQNIFDLLDAAGVPWQMAAENLAESRGYDVVHSAIDGFLNSPAHRANLLEAGFSRVGVGTATLEDGTTIVTVVFAD